MLHTDSQRFPGKRYAAVALVSLLVLALCAGDVRQDPIDTVATLLRCRVTPLSAQAPSARNGLVRQPELVKAVYLQRDYRPAWSDGTNPLNHVEEFLAAVRVTPGQGLSPVDYHLGRIQTALAGLTPRPGDPSALAGRLAALDLMLTDGFLNLASDLAHRRGGDAVDLVRLTQRALATGNIRAALQSLNPPGA